ncbi:uncharacterized protein LOC110760241 [Prunus avium]|uniref:Uncharacterized protein LOC110760241 n=1 Tax=Prunus avium TaxID=42229 RepID=A0A6P5SVL8_PRUAV|nr:uncharacterized protein LOC110760241 [Prunus avium]XP_021818168.1 uncharacterized protein LOC110760241 [Prunus avium]
MAADVPVNLEVVNSCCAAWKKECSEIENRRNALRQAVHLLTKACEVEKTRANIEKKEKEKESSIRVSLENEISGLKSEIYSLKQRGNADAQNRNEVNLLKAQVSDCEKEINRLKDLIEREKKRAESESKNAEVEKKKACEARKAAKAEKSKADEERKRANTEKQKADNYGLQLEVLKKEVHKASSNLASETLKLVEANKKLEAEKQKVVKERECANSAVAKAEEQKKFAEVNRTKSIEEKSRAECLSVELVESRKRIDELQKEINEIRCSRELHEAPGSQPDNNRKVMELPNFEEAYKRYETEKQKAIKEKKRAESEMAKAEKQKKRVEVNWKKAMEEKSRADHLFTQLDEAKKKIEELSPRKLIEASAVELGKDMGAESAKVKDLKKQLKFEKMQKKHAKEVVKLERSRNSILQQELGRLKFEFDQFSQRLGMLNTAFSHSAEGIDDPEKMNIESGFKRLKPNCPVLDASQRTAPFLPLSGGNCTDSISGIDSILESPVRGSNRKMLQSYPINSSTASFSDRKLVGSQDKGAFSLTTSEKLVEENVQPTISNLSAEVTKINCYENVAVVAENSVRSPVRTDGVGRVNEQSRKRKRILHAVESIENLYFEGKKLHLRVEENLSVLHCLLNKQIEKPFEEGSYLLPGLQGDSSVKHGRDYEKGKESTEEKLIMQNYANGNEQKKANKFENEVCGCANVCRQVSKNANELVWIPQESRDGTSDFETMSSFYEVTDGNYLKLLDLDDAADEELYRMATEMPLSPTLPEIEVRGVERSNVEINSNSLYFDDSENFNNSVLHKNGDTVDSFTIIRKTGNGNSIAMGTDCGVQDSGAEVMSNAPNSRNEEAMLPFGSELGYAGDDILTCYVVFSNIKDSSSISRICSASRTCITQCSLATHTDWMVREILLALKTEENLFPKEKVCVFFSLLLLNFSTAALSKFGSLKWTSNLCLDAFARHMGSVMSDGDGRSIFAEFGCLDESLSLIEDFLINGRVLVCKDASSEARVECHSMVNILCDGIHISSRPASADELVAGSVVLASICAAFDHIGFISEMSYSILQISRSSHSLVLTILHAFAYIGGEKFFNFCNFNLVIVMRSIVTYLERVSISDSSGSCIPSASNSRTVFCTCVKCPFSEDAVSVDTATSFLLERLQIGALSGATYQDAMESGSSNSNYCILLNKYKAEQIAYPDNCGLGVHGDLSCCLNKFAVPSIQSDSSTNFTLCDLSDLLSLVELVAINMSWEWTSAKIVPRLLKVLESCMTENVIAGIVVLLGQLGRLGVDALGYEDKGVEILRGQLSAFLCRDSAISVGLPTQIATVTALVGLMPSDFETIIQGNVEPAAIASQSDPAQSIRKWFSLLPKKQQDLSFGFLQTAGIFETTGRV